MKNLIKIIGNILLLSVLIFSCKDQKEKLPEYRNNSGKLWATGYLPGWRHTAQEIPFMKKEDYNFLTQIIHFAGIPQQNGSIDVEQLNVGSDCRKLAVEKAHSAGIPILFSVVGQYAGFNQIIKNPKTRNLFINNLITIMTESGYDGIDLDMEPVCAPFGSFGYLGVDINKKPEFKTEFPINYAYISLVRELRSELNKRKTPLLDRPLLTAAILWRDRHIFGREEVHSCFDQINMMTYDMSGPQDGEVTWFDSPLYNGGFLFPKYKMPAYSIEMFVDYCLEAGIPAKKLGIGICMDALVWQGGDGVAKTGGVTAPRQTWNKLPSHPHLGSQRYTYAEMLDKFFSAGNYNWDEIAQVPYLSIDLPGSSSDMFISFNNERSIKAKMDYIKKRELGGFIIWELSADYLPNQPEGQQRPLRKAMQEALELNREKKHNE